MKCLLAFFSCDMRLLKSMSEGKRNKSFCLINLITRKLQKLINLIHNYLLHKVQMHFLKNLPKYLLSQQSYNQRMYH